MEKHLIRTLSVLVALLVATACDNDEFFELTNPPESPWLTLADFEKAPIGAYYGLSGNGGFRHIYSHGYLAGMLYGDGVRIGDIAEGFNINADIEDMYMRTTEGTQIGIFDNGLYRSGYFGVGFANAAIQHIVDNDGNPYPDDNRQDEVDRIHGELRFVRAYAYYWLARIYLPAFPNSEKRIPWRTEQAANLDEAFVSELASADDIYPFIIEDLRQAKALLPERYDASLHPVAYEDGRANAFAASALLAKVLFHTGDFAGAEAELDYVIDQNGGDYDLSEDPIEAWNKTGVSRGREVIWYYALWAGDGLGGSSNWKHPGRMESYSADERRARGPQSNNGRHITCSDHFLETVGWQDVNGDETAEALEDLRYQQLFVRFNPTDVVTVGVNGDTIFAEPNTSFITTRPYVWGNKYYRAGNRITNVPLLRLADMYLLRAAINATNGQTGDARADLNAVRNRAGLADYAGTDADLLDAIHTERFKEMAFEGDRLYYLQGLDLPISGGDRSTGEVPSKGPFFSEVPDFEVELNQAYNN
ncbi:MAG: RagB/SusD family nutrient uptake outer membrane protein [Bacteroidota bacterium]